MTVASQTYCVYHHCGSQCNIVERELSKEDAIGKCAELNEQEEKGNGHFYTTDANDGEREQQ